MIRLLVVLAVVVSASAALAQRLPAGLDPQNTILIGVEYGRIVIKLRPDLAPRNVERIKTLARDKFYDNVPFHRVIPGLLAQTGDGQRGDGTGVSKYPNLPAEFTNTPFVREIVGMARTQDPNSANSQFFITYADATFLNGKYTVVGEVVSGMDVVDMLKKGEATQNGIVTDPDRMLQVRVAADVPSVTTSNPLPQSGQRQSTALAGVSTTTVPMQINGGTYVIPVVINGAITLDFVVDSGAADVSIPADVVSTLMRTKTLKESDFLGQKTYVLADGSKVPSQTFRIRSLKVGDKVLENVTGSVASGQGSLLLGQSFLSRFRSWSIDNTKHALIFK